MFSRAFAMLMKRKVKRKTARTKKKSEITALLPTLCVTYLIGMHDRAYSFSPVCLPESVGGVEEEEEIKRKKKKKGNRRCVITLRFTAIDDRGNSPFLWRGSVLCLAHTAPTPPRKRCNRNTHKATTTNNRSNSIPTISHK